MLLKIRKIEGTSSYWSSLWWGETKVIKKIIISNDGSIPTHDDELSDSFPAQLLQDELKTYSGGMDWMSSAVLAVRDEAKWT